VEEIQKMRDKQTSKKLVISLAALLVLATGGTATFLALQPDKAKPQPVATETTTTKKPAGVQPVNYRGEEGKNALELLQAHATVITKDSSYGPYVDSINGVAGGTDGKYWAFYVHGELAQVGAGAYTTKNGDNFEWKFE
jgi:hypothetical protein